MSVNKEKIVSFLVHLFSISDATFIGSEIGKTGDKIVMIWESKEQRYRVYSEETFHRSLNKLLPGPQMGEDEKKQQMKLYDLLFTNGIKISIRQDNRVCIGAEAAGKNRFGNRIVVYKCQQEGKNGTFIKTYVCSPEVFKGKYPNLTSEVDKQIAAIDNRTEARRRQGKR